MAKLTITLINKFKVYPVILSIVAITICFFMFHIILISYSNINSLRTVSDIIANQRNINTNLIIQYNKQSLKINCYEQSLEPKIEQHGNFWVLYNYVRAEKQHRCNESVTFTTQGDYSFLDNLIMIVKRWKGPVSVALHAPGTDFKPTLDSIAYLRECESSLIKQFISFHIIIDSQHLPKNLSSNVPLSRLYKDTFNCSRGSPYANISYQNLYKTKANLSYPINVARNVAKQASQTHYVLAADIELYPSLNLIEDFLQMIRRKDFGTKQLMVFALPVFEISENELPPENKSALKKLFDTQKAFSFHKNICERCHAIPNLTQWMNLTASDSLDIFIKAKRQGKQVRWEAVYIGTRDDPAFDERLDWERHGNKMAQAYILCVLDYDYLVLNNAFLVHKPGIKKKMVNAEVIPNTAKYINKVLGKEINLLFGTRKGCIA